MATPTLIDVSRGAIDVNLQDTIPGATVRNTLTGSLRTSYQAQWDTGGAGTNIKNSNTWDFFGTNLSNSQITMFILEGTTDYQKQQMVNWRDQCIDEDRDDTREFTFQITVNTTFTSTGAWHGQSKYTCFARYFGSSDWNGRVDRIYMGLNNDGGIGGNALTSTASANNSELIRKIAGGDINGITYSLSGITVFFDAQEDDTLGPPSETNHNFKSNFLDDVCLDAIGSESSTRVLALNADDCIVETTVSATTGGDIAIQEGGTEQLAAATAINFNADDFDVAVDATTATISLANSNALAILNHTQSTAATQWSINNTLNSVRPVITVYDSTGEVILPMSVTALTGGSGNTVTIEFPIAVAGFATLVG